MVKNDMRLKPGITALSLMIYLEILVLPIIGFIWEPPTNISKSEQGNSFIAEPQDITVLRNSSITLSCKIASSAMDESVQWTKAKFGLGTDRQLVAWPRFRITGKNPKTDWDLEIDPVTVDDDDVYQCQVTLGFTSSLRSRKARVNVLVPPQDPFILEGPILNVKESRDVALTCIAKGGKPAAKLNWYDDENNLMNDASSYNTKRMGDGKLFEASSTIVITPTRDHHKKIFRCEASNEADDLPAVDDSLVFHSSKNRKAAKVTLLVQYAPSVSVQPIRPGMVQEGDEATYRCDAEANPAPYHNSYKWYIDDHQVQGQFREYFKIYNVTSVHNNKQIKCSVENELGTAMGLRTIEVKYGPSMIISPQTTSGDKMNAIMLFCAVDSNPSPKYYWTKGNSREVISNRQNMTVAVTEESVGTYYCHAEVPGYKTITSRPGADVLMTGPPRFTSATTQSGIVGENVHINCAAISVPQPQKGEIKWIFHETEINEDNSHYRIINSAIQHGIRSTLVIRESLKTDFGTYKCSIKNAHGTKELQIRLQQKRPFPLQLTLIAIFGGIILILLMSIICILFRKRICCCCFPSKKQKDVQNNSAKNNCGDSDAKNLRKVNNIVDQLTNTTTQYKQEIISPLSRENDIACWGDSEIDNDGGFITGTMCRSSTAGGVSQGTTQLCGSGDLIMQNQDYQSQPDVINGGYISYGHTGDYNPPGPANSRSMINDNNGNSNILAPVPGSVLNVSDPRFSATYGNPYLKQSDSFRADASKTYINDMKDLPENVQMKCECYTPQRTSSSEGYTASTPIRTSSSEGYGSIQSRSKKKHVNSAERQWKKKVTSDIPSFYESRPLPPTRTVSSASSAMSSSSCAFNCKPCSASTAEYVTISQETLRNGSSSIIGIGPGQSLQQRENPATNQYFGSLQRPNNNVSLQTQVNSTCQNSSTKTLPMNPHLNRFNNLNQPNGMIHSNNYTAIPLTPNQQGNLNKTISLNNSASSQTPTPPPPEMTVKQLPTSQSTFAGMGTHV